MPQSLPTPPAQTHANTLRSDLNGVRMVPARARIRANSESPNAGVSPAFLALIKRGMSDLDVTQKVMALNAKHVGCSESALCEAMKDGSNRNFSIEWFWAQDDAFVLYVLDLAMAARGFTPDGIRATKIARIKELIGLILEVA